LQRGAQVNIQSSDGKLLATDTIYQWRFNRRDPPELEIQKLQIINWIMIPGSTPLYIAAQEGHSDVVEQLLSRSADIECVFRDGYTPLYIAAQNGRVEVVKTLLAKGANREASCKCFILSVKVLLPILIRLPNLGSHGSTPLYIACQQGQLEVAKVLLEAKCNIEAVFKTGFTPLYVAAR
jgi:ankyrin repeat protein